MISKKRFDNFETFENPFPVLVFNNFLNKEESLSAIESIKKFNFNEKVMGERQNIRKGTESFNKILKDKSILSEIYNFFNNKETYEYLLSKLENLSENSKNNYRIKNKPFIFKKEFYEYKRSLHARSAKMILFNIINKIFKINFNKNKFYFEVNYSMAKKGYKLTTHRDKENRIIVFLLYLNELDEEGGALEIYSENIGKNNINFNLEKKFKPSAGKLVVFLSNPLSYHNVGEITKSKSKRYFCYGSYSSLENVIWTSNK